jgi:frataxin-like iron-binding protein CyaY
MTKKRLHKKIEKKLDKLQELLDEINEAQSIDPNDSET